jgi:plastocyanin
MRALIVIGVILGLAAARADAGTVEGTVTVTRPEGVDASPVLVYLVGFDEKAPKKTVEILQKGKKFLPDLVAITAGQTVSFPNGDPFLHNVFSPSSARPFDLGSFPEGKKRSRTFPDTGVIDVFCNIHPEMSATIVVLPNRRFAFADDDGHFSIDGVPEGSWTIYAYSRHARKPVKADVTVTADGTATVDLALEEVARDFQHKNKYGEDYKDEGATYR